MLWQAGQRADHASCPSAPCPLTPAAHSAGSCQCSPGDTCGSPGRCHGHQPSSASAAWEDIAAVAATPGGCQSIRGWKDFSNWVSLCPSCLWMEAVFHFIRYITVHRGATQGRGTPWGPQGGEGTRQSWLWSTLLAPLHPRARPTVTHGMWDTARGRLCTDTVGSQGPVRGWWPPALSAGPWHSQHSLAESSHAGARREHPCPPGSSRVLPLVTLG